MRRSVLLQQISRTFSEIGNWFVYRPLSFNFETSYNFGQLIREVPFQNVAEGLEKILPPPSPQILNTQNPPSPPPPKKKVIIIIMIKIILINNKTNFGTQIFFFCPPFPQIANTQAPFTRILNLFSVPHHF